MTALRTDLRRGRLLVAVAVLAAFGTAVVSLTGGRTAQAATVFSDTFDDGDATGWTRSGGSWSVVTDGSPVYRQASTSSTARSLASAGSRADSSVAVRVKPLAFNGAGRYAAIASRVQNTTNFYYLALLNTNRVELRRLVGGASTTLAAASLPVTTGTWYTLRLDAAGTALRGYVDNTLRVSATDSTFGAGTVGLATLNASAEYDDVTVEDVVAPPPSTTPPATTPPPGPGTQPADLVGFATVNALGQNGTTGGSGGPSVTVSTAAEFADFATRPGPVVIRVSGVIPLTAMQDVASDKSILGVGSASGFTGFGLNVGLPVDEVTTPPADAVHNVIIRNLTFTNSGDDAVNVQMFSHHVWVDHNDLCCSHDGLVDIKRGSSYVTVSWNHTHNHTKNMLLGHDDNNDAQDVGRLKVTYHHNWFDQTPQRNPRVRFGEPVHVFNNYYLHNTDVGVACQENAGCMIEGNYFENTEEPATIHYAGGTGRAVARNNVFVGESGPPDVGGTVQEPNTYYQYTVDDPNTVKTTVTAGAGPGKVTP